MEELKNIALDAAVRQKVATWLQPPYDEKTGAVIRELICNQDVTELTDAFYKDLAFGTGGLRGIMGAGTNRMNPYTVGRATQGLSNYLRKIYPNEPVRVAVSYDSRNGSKEFAQMVADVFAANGFDVYLFEALRPTPQLSFAIRQLNCQSGVMITASHNPKEYNGYKAYWKDGGQLVSPHDVGVIEEVGLVSDPDDVKRNGPAERIHTLGQEMDELYMQKVSALSLRSGLEEEKKALKIVFSSLHGTGGTLVSPLLAKWGFSQVYSVAGQMEPDGDFPTVVYPNPEEPEAMTLAIEEAIRRDADLVMATDPDADRVGLAIRLEKGKFELLNGNQIGSLLVAYVLSSLAEKGQLKKDDYVVKTIVTTGLIADIAASYQLPCYDVLTGFKYIGELMTQKEGQGRFLVGGEESFGYLIGDLVRDKDAVISCAFIAEMAAYYRSQSKSLNDVLLELYQQHGYYLERLVSLTKKGKSGAEEIQQMMEGLRFGGRQNLGEIPIARINDYKQRVSSDLLSGKTEAIELPISDVLQFITVEGDIISVRPSGTEPKIKFYCSVREPLADLKEASQIKKVLESKIERIMADILK